MNRRDQKNLISDLGLILVDKIRRIVSDRKGCIDLELYEGECITVCDMPHLLAISAHYDVNVEIYPIAGEILGVYISWNIQDTI